MITLREKISQLSTERDGDPAEVIHALEKQVDELKAQVVGLQDENRRLEDKRQRLEGVLRLGLLSINHRILVTSGHR